MKPRFSVIIPLYNKETYVKKALESVIAQTYKDFECIVVDDGSTDGSLDVAREIIDSKPKTRNPESSNDASNSLDQQSPQEQALGQISVQTCSNVLPDSLQKNSQKNAKNNIILISQPNAGVAAARNNGVAKSMGEFVCFLDADDWWEANFLEEMDRLIKEYPDAGLYATNYIYYKPGKTHVALKLERGYMNYPEAYLHSDAMPVWTGAACLPRKVFDEMGGFPNGIKLGEDFLLWAKTALHYKVAFSEKPLAYYNNDVPASLRATRNLHAPEHHMLFHLDEIEELINHKFEILNPKSVAWHALLDKLRASGLLDYWMSDEYHNVAAAELAKVDWSKQPRNAKCQYEKPICVLKAKRRFKQIGSAIKLCLIKVVKR